jgi:hypothetical protein
MKSFDRIKKYFVEQPFPRSAFQISSHCLSGIRASHKEGKIKKHFYLPLERGVILPSFTRNNIQRPKVLQEKLKEGLEELRLSDRRIASLLPELSIKVFVFSFDSLPSSRRERDQIIRFRIKKQMPLLPEDVKFSVDRIKYNHREKVIVAIARSSVIQEYEDLFGHFNLKVRAVGAPTLSLNNLMSEAKEKSLLVLNVEEDFLSLIAIVNSEIALYRLKPFSLDSESSVLGSERVENIVKEVENTVHFIEDREKKKLQSLWVRLGIVDLEGEMFLKLQEKVSLPLKGIGEFLPSELSSKEKTILSPLFGQI